MTKIQRRADLQQIMTIIPNLQGMEYDDERNEELNVANQFMVEYKADQVDLHSNDVDKLQQKYEENIEEL